MLATLVSYPAMYVVSCRKQGTEPDSLAPLLWEYLTQQISTLTLSAHKKQPKEAETMY